MKLLPFVYLANPHTHPQSYLLCPFPSRYISVKLPFVSAVVTNKVGISIDYDRFLQIEKMNPVSMQKLYGINVDIKINVTEHKNYREYFSADLYQIANTIYHEDFELFSYKKEEQ